MTMDVHTKKNLKTQKNKPLRYLPKFLTPKLQIEMDEILNKAFKKLIIKMVNDFKQDLRNELGEKM